MSEQVKHKFHTFLMAMQEEASLYEGIQKVFEITKDKEEAAKMIHERYAKDFEAAMDKSKAAWLDWQYAMDQAGEKEQ